MTGMPIKTSLFLCGSLCPNFSPKFFMYPQSVVLAEQTAVTSAPISKSIIRPRRICTHGRFLARWQELARVILDALNGPRKLVFALPYDTVIR